MIGSTVVAVFVRKRGSDEPWRECYSPNVQRLKKSIAMLGTEQCRERELINAK